MRILFMDESGTPRKPDAAYPRYFVVGGISVPDLLWHSLRDGLMGLKIRYGIRGEIKWRYFSPDNCDRKNPMLKLDIDQKNAIRTEIYALICAHKAIKTFACIISHEAAYQMQSITCQSDVYHLAYKGVTERFQYHLQEVSKMLGSRELGIVVADHRGSEDDRLLKQVHQKLLHSSGKSISDYKNLIEGLFLEQSHLSIGIQLADMVAGAVWRHFERGDSHWYDQLSSSFRKSPSGAIEGYGIVKSPKRGWT